MVRNIVLTALGLCGIIATMSANESVSNVSLAVLGAVSVVVFLMGLLPLIRDMD